MRDSSIILNQLKKAKGNKYLENSIGTLIIPLSYEEELKLELVCTREGTTIQEVVGNVIREQLDKFNEIMEETDYDQSSTENN